MAARNSLASVGTVIALGCRWCRPWPAPRPAAQGAGLMRDPQALGQQQFQLGAEAAPMAQI
jgi:hypothetical protein